MPAGKLHRRIAVAFANPAGKSRDLSRDAMAYLEWSPMFSVGVSRLDEQHKRLFVLMNDFCEAHAQHRGHEQVPAVLNRLIQYAQHHFRDEEAMMESAGYGNLEAHQAVHEQLTEQIFALHSSFESGDLKTTDQLQAFLRDWLIKHIMQVDMQYAPFFEAEGIR
jgi:hemerythrin